MESEGPNAGPQASASTALRAPSPQGPAASAKPSVSLAADNKAALGAESSGDLPPPKRLKLTCTSAARLGAAASDGGHSIAESSGMLQHRPAVSNEVRRACGRDQS